MKKLLCILADVQDGFEMSILNPDGSEVKTAKLAELPFDSSPVISPTGYFTHSAIGDGFHASKLSSPKPDGKTAVISVNGRPLSMKLSLFTSDPEAVKAAKAGTTVKATAEMSELSV